MVRAASCIAGKARRSPARRLAASGAGLACTAKVGSSREAASAIIGSLAAWSAGTRLSRLTVPSTVGSFCRRAATAATSPIEGSSISML